MPSFAAEDTVRVATFNVENLGDTGGGGATLAERVRLLRPQLVRLRADVLCLQEVDAQHVRGRRGRALDALDDLVEGTEYASFERATTLSRSRRTPRDKHNLVVLSRFPIVQCRQVFHTLVHPPLHRVVSPSDDGAEPVAVEWERPLLHVTIDVNGGRRLNVVNVHLRAPRAAFVPGAKADRRTWRTMAAWAEGFFLAAVKSAGQALEARLIVDALFDEDPDALIVVAGDFNADLNDASLRIIRGDEEDAGNPHLAFRALVPVDRSLAESRRYSVVHHGRPQMLDHLLVSRSLLAWYRGVEVHNEALGDELVTPQAVHGAPQSFHAPLVAEFRLPEPPGDVPSTG